MSTNGSSVQNGNDAPIPDPFDGDEGLLRQMAEQLLWGRYVPFEQMVSTLMSSAMEAGLLAVDASNSVDTNSLIRNFEVALAPGDWPFPPEMWAEIRFEWPVEYTVLSTTGDGIFCDLYHPDEDDCSHQLRTAQISLALEIDYIFPVAFAQKIDSDEGIEATAKRIRQVFEEEVNHENIVRVDVMASYSDLDLHLVNLKAHHVWILDEELTDLVHLVDILFSLCVEVRTVLLRFSQEFAGGPDGNGSK
ncbi:MAG: hypothetical protein U9R25_02255 [Chloroflexota bacterium]|nr:hypothetical protein [Chloroflexota bacterium]